MSSDEYPLQVPRWLHKPYGDTLKVDTADECEAARADGWLLQPPAWPPEPKPKESVSPKRAKRSVG